MKKIFITLALVLPILTLSVSAQAISAREAKELGLVAENCDGYVRPLKPEGQMAAKQINEERRSEYTRIAQQTGAAVDYVAQETGRKLCG